MHNRPPYIHVVSQINPLHTSPPHSLKTHFNIPSGLFPSHLSTSTLYAPLLSSIRAISPAHLVLLNLITRLIFGKQC